MSKFSNHSEQIASYLDGQMTPVQMQEFEKQLHTDPLLRSEFELQNDIIHSIKDFRKTQLKTRLDQVPVGMGPSAMIGMKAAAALVISGIIGVGAYLYFNSSVEEIPAVTEVVAPAVTQETTDEPLNLIPEETVDNNFIEETTNEPELVEEQPKVVNTEPKADAASTEEVSEFNPTEKELIANEDIAPVINSPKLATPNLEDAEVEESLQIPSASLTQDALADNNVVAVETTRKDGDMFHYQYYQGKLYLYGDFRENPYEILELNSATGKRLFIYYNNDYYKIQDDQQQITPLVKLSDQDVIKKLEIIQANK